MTTSVRIPKKTDRIPWVRTKCGERVKPPNQQASNQHLSNDQVMRSRTEPIGSSNAGKLNVTQSHSVDGGAPNPGYDD